ncbi:TetR/AcrR family transcriptional regulator [Amycolatopsis sp. K13G38]|uniref:TetR/AcrR family transcriptional regulator n=1 Tax=Amycolatopsis acididurans TaxID=2724524 RepID=A0ABX1JJW0_9PSEU|nr:TetR/AcrR family transcriptional regulator [Amycolatopsis acididurans]NKQ58936.1 TetR/AcrR family transcriptional regulator [Amycolatopsis acididurans]
MTADAELRLRADARRNRDQIIAAAKQVFGESGPEAPMEEIARRAGVGIGTLYRRFPDREALIRGVARDNFAAVLAEARAAAAEEQTAWQALVRLIGRSSELQLSVQLGLVSPVARQVIRSDPATAEYREAILSELDDIVRAAQAEGALRDDVGTGDVALIVSMLLRPLPLADGESATLMRERVAALLVDGLRPGTRLPGRPITGAELRP